MNHTREHQVIVQLEPAIYWKLVKMGAELQTPVEEYVRCVLLTHIVEED